MELAPGSIGALALVDSISHPLSLLQDVDPDPAARVEDVRLDDLGPARGLPDGHLQQLHFRWTSPRGDIACRIDLHHKTAPPRPAGYGFDGDYAVREIELPDYRMFFRRGAPTLDAGPTDDSQASSAPRVSVPDPLDRRVGRFLRELDATEFDVDQAFLPARRMRMLSAILDAAQSR